MAALSTVEKCCHWTRGHELEYGCSWHMAFSDDLESRYLIPTSSLGAIQRLSFSKYLKKRSGTSEGKRQSIVKLSCPTPQPAARPAYSDDADDIDSDFAVIDIYWYWRRLTFRVLDYQEPRITARIFGCRE